MYLCVILVRLFAYQKDNTMDKYCCLNYQSNIQSNQFINELIDE